jgi:hypothetical protein
MINFGRRGLRHNFGRLGSQQLFPGRHRHTLASQTNPTSRYNSSLVLILSVHHYLFFLNITSNYKAKFLKTQVFFMVFLDIFGLFIRQQG